MKTYNLSFLSAGVLSCCILIGLLSSCKKSSGGSGNSTTNTSGYYLTATVNGQAWAANVADDTLKTPVYAAPDYTGSATLMVLLGIQAAGKDSSAIALIFPSDITLNKTVAMNASAYVEAVYALGSAGYNTVSPTNTTDDSLTVTSYDQTNQVIEGSFKGTFYSTTSSQKVTITNGKFRSPILASTSQLPPSNVKF